MAVDDQKVSNQHELNGSEPLRMLLGEAEVRSGRLNLIWLRRGSEPEAVESSFTWYDARAAHPERSEWRLYYTGDPDWSEGDLVAILRPIGSKDLTIVIAERGSTWESQLLGLLSWKSSGSGHFEIHRITDVPPEFRPIASEFFELLGLREPCAKVSVDDLELIRSSFPDVLPDTQRFSAFARQHSPKLDSPDAQLLVWFQREEELFRAHEAHTVNPRLSQANSFASVEDFVQFASGVLNRRKSRAGRALENHFEALAVSMGLGFDRSPRTEGGRRPDFLFPGVREYRDSTFPDARLTVLGAKTTCKDRWRQVLNEAARVPTKHLLTLEAGISRGQLTEMMEERVQLVVPKALHSTFEPPAGYKIHSVAEFFNLVTERASAR